MVSFQQARDTGSWRKQFVKDQYLCAGECNSFLFFKSEHAPYRTNCPFVSSLTFTPR